VDAESVSRESHGRMYWLDLSYSKVLVRVRKGPGTVNMRLASGNMSWLQILRPLRQDTFPDASRV